MAQWGLMGDVGLRFPMNCWLLYSRSSYYFSKKGFDGVVFKVVTLWMLGKSPARRWGYMLMFMVNIPTESSRRA